MSAFAFIQDIKKSVDWFGVRTGNVHLQRATQVEKQIAVPDLIPYRADEASAQIMRQTRGQQRLRSRS